VGIMRAETKRAREKNIFERSEKEREVVQVGLLATENWIVSANAACLYSAVAGCYLKKKTKPSGQ
jgi:hypothetical protein